MAIWSRGSRENHDKHGQTAACLVVQAALSGQRLSQPLLVGAQLARGCSLPSTGGSNVFSIGFSHKWIWILGCTIIWMFGEMSLRNKMFGEIWRNITGSLGLSKNFNGWGDHDENVRKLADQPKCWDGLSRWCESRHGCICPWCIYVIFVYSNWLIRDQRSKEGSFPKMERWYDQWDDLQKAWDGLKRKKRPCSVFSRLQVMSCKYPPATMGCLEIPPFFMGIQSQWGGELKMAAMDRNGWLKPKKDDGLQDMDDLLFHPWFSLVFILPNIRTMLESIRMFPEIGVPLKLILKSSIDRWIFHDFPL